MPIDTLIDAVARVAKAWREPDHPARSRAVAATLKAPNRFTEEAVAYELNRTMEMLRPGLLRRWAEEGGGAERQALGIRHTARTALDGLIPMLVVLLRGHAYVGVLRDASPALLPAFREALEAAGAQPDVTFAPADRLDVLADAVWTPPDERYAVAVLDGQETEQELEGLAEDALLHEGLADRNVRLLWAPEALAPDALLDAFAHFRAVCPAHPETPGALKMQQAFLEATGQSHAHGDGLEFLLSKGEAEVPAPGHLRWAPYTDVAEVQRWLTAQGDALTGVTARKALAGRAALAPDGVPLIAPGEAHRPTADALAAGVRAWLDAR